MLSVSGAEPEKNFVERRDKMKRFANLPPVWTLSYFAIYLPWFMALEARDPSECTIVQLHVDRMIPFCEYFVIPYLLWFFYIGAVVTYLILNRPKGEYYRFAALLFGGFTVCLILYSFFYTGLDLRPAIDPGKNIFTWMTSRVWAADTSTNVCPSIHVYATLAAQSALVRCRLRDRHPICYALCSTLSISIILSTMFLKQHSVLDVLCAFALFGVIHLAVHGVPAPEPRRSRLVRVRT